MQYIRNTYIFTHNSVEIIFMILHWCQASVCDYLVIFEYIKCDSSKYEYAA